MKVIFLDVDGVLNCKTTKERCMGYIGIDRKKVLLLKHICAETGAEIVLVSTWKSCWYKEPEKKCEQDGFADELDKSLGAFGLTIFDRTYDDIFDRADEILKWLEQNPAEKFVILDDEDFSYKQARLNKFWVKTDYNTGLTAELCERAIEILR